MLKRLYHELSSQTYINFEWVVVNDGSTDDTDEVMKQLIADNKLHIQYIKKPNGGKHTAWRVATSLFQGKYVVTADDDDPISQDMLQIFDKYWSELEQSPDYESFWEIRSRCKDEYGNLVGKELPLPYYDSDYNTISYKHHIFCEMVGCRKLSVLQNEAAVPQRFLFMENASNFDESIRWSRAARKFKTRFIPDVTRIYISTPNSLCNNTFERCMNGDVKILANKMVEFYYTLSEKSDILLKWDKARYLRAIIGFSLLTTKCKVPISKIPLDKSIKITMKCLRPFFSLYLHYKHCK
ncbi:MAG: glycosyltransferase family 2 protein [Muribaculum sp.]|nr:glycosyltransferase family 2 protein [Muribaculum sp.]